MVAISAQRASEAVTTVAAVSEENSAAAEEVSAATEEMAAQVEETVASTQILAELAQNLGESVSVFHLDAASLANTKANTLTVTRPTGSHTRRRQAA